MSVAVIPETGGEPDTVGVFTGGQYLPGSDPQAPPTGFHFQPSFNMAVGPDGYFVTDGRSYSINGYDTSGRLRRVFRLAREPRQVTDDVKAAYEDQRREEIMAYGDRLEEPPEVVLRRALSAPYPSHLPTFEWLHVDSEGNVWAGQEPRDQGDDMNDFHVFGPDGRYLGVVEVPATLQVFRIGADFVLGMVGDDLGVQYIHRYRIEK